MRALPATDSKVQMPCMREAELQPCLHQQAQSCFRCGSGCWWSLRLLALHAASCRAACASVGCSGKRARTGQVQLSSFGERELVSDYRLLEEAVLLAEAARRSRRRLEDGAMESSCSLKFLLQQVGGEAPHASGAPHSLLSP